MVWQSLRLLAEIKEQIVVPVFLVLTGATVRHLSPYCSPGDHRE
jgi:hypothetical protein